MGIYSSCKALIVGVSRYSDPQYDLSYARSDAEAMAELLGNEFGFDQVWTLYDSDATRQNIIRFFEQDLQRTDEDDGLVIFFAGHGITVTSAIGDDRGFLVPHDGNPKQPYANISLTAIRDDYLPMIPAKHVFLIVDACYGGLALRDIATVERSQAIDEAVLAELTRRDRKVRQVLAAGTKDQKVLDGGLFGHSVFTGRLIEALREANPYITADHVGVHVRERVARDSLDRHHHQTPQFGYLAGGDGTFVFSRKISKPPQSTPRRERVETKPPSADAVVAQQIPTSPVLTEEDVRGVIDRWSERARFLRVFKCLSPLCAHCELTGINQTVLFRFDLRVLCVERTLSYDKRPCSGQSSQEVKPFSGDVWSLRFDASNGFVDRSEVWTSPNPNAIENCSTCSRSGHVHCETCDGEGVIVTSCEECSGKGRIAHCKTVVCPVCGGNPLKHSKSTFMRGCTVCNNEGVISDGYQVCPVCGGYPLKHQKSTFMMGCSVCNGTGVVGTPNTCWEECRECSGTGRKKRTCDNCEGRGTRRCGDCAGGGKLASYARVTARFEVREKSLHFPTDAVSAQLHPSEWARLWSGTELEAVPESLLQMRPNMKRDVEAALRELKASESVRILRLQACLFMSPIVACRLKHQSRDFTIMIHGISKRVLASEWTPKNLRYAIGLLIGIPTTALFVIASVGFATTAATLPAAVCLVGSVASAAWVMWSFRTKLEPKPKKGGQADAV